MPSLASVAGVVALAVSSTTASSVELANNWCTEKLYLTVNSSGQLSGPMAFPSHDAFLSNITGEGNSLGVTKTEDYFSPDTPKLILGTSTDDGVLYWTISSVDGDPFAGTHFNVTSNGTSPDVCGHATRYDHQVHACADTNQTLTLNLCSEA